MTDDMQRARELLAAECIDRAASLEKSAASDRETGDSIQEAIDSGEGITPDEPQDVAAGLLNDAERAEETAGLLRRAAAALRTAPEWQPIETAPEGRLVVVGWLDTEYPHYPENYEFDYLEDGIWAKHEDCVEHAHAVAPPSSKMPKKHPPYQWWMDLPAFPAARPQEVE